MMTISRGSHFFQRLLSLKENSNAVRSSYRRRSNASTLSRISTFLESGKIVILGKYELQSKLGQGGLGEVYTAIHLADQTRVALKIILPPQQGTLSFSSEDFSQTSRLRLLREIQAAATVQSQYVVRALDAGEEFGLGIFVMEWIDGLDTGYILRRVKEMSIANACEIARQTALGLADIQRAGFVHRDIKPSNLMISRNGQLKILDLGLSRPDAARSEEESVAELTRMHALMGTADYLSPEQALDARSADIRSDIYSLGCTLFKLLTGQAPYAKPQNDTFQKKLMAHRDERIPSLADRRSDAPPALCLLLTQLLAKVPQDRLENPLAVVQALYPFCKDANLTTLARQAKDLPTTSLDDEPNTASLDDHSSRDTTDTNTSASAGRLRHWSRRQVIGTAAVTSGLIAVGGYAAVQRRTQLAFKQLQFFAGSKTKKIIYDPAQGELLLSSRFPQFTQVISPTVGEGIAEITISCTGPLLANNSQCGIFLGLRLGIAQALPRAYGQLFTFQRRDDVKHGIVNQLFLVRQLATVSDEGITGTVDHSYRYQDSALRTTSAKIPWPSKRSVTLRVEYTKTAVQRILVNGQSIPALCAPELARAYSPSDFASPVGIYSVGQSIATVTEMHFSSPAT